MRAVGARLDDYQQFTDRTAVYPQLLAVPYLALGLGDEGGELLEKVVANGLSRENDTLAEVGDVMWYLAQLMLRRGVMLSTVYERSLTLSSSLHTAELGAVANHVVIHCSKLQGRVKKELRDGSVNEAAVLEYAAQVMRSLDTIARVLGSNLLFVVERNREKLLDRLERDAIKGEGDAR